AEMLAMPDMVDRVWYDPRKNEKIDNRRRALAAAETTLKSLLRAKGNGEYTTMWSSLKHELRDIFELKDYDLRKAKLSNLSGNSSIDYEKTDKRIREREKAAFVRAASAHLSAAVSTFEDLPRVPPL
ncbi:MAG: hypothetical protein JRJ37_03485, partial [Deltaproteobacteria bacterium]|nr:hypothetical protein [Deltaproteobacteria bacterium]